MDDPIKIIHKYKNNSGRIQYHIHIFIGDIVDDTCMKVLKEIKDLDLYSSWTSLGDRDRTMLEKNYNEFWYEKFFNSYHINSTKKNVIENSVKLKELKSIYGDKWVTDHIINYKKRLQITTFSYEYVVREERER